MNKVLKFTFLLIFSLSTILTSALAVSYTTYGNSQTYDRIGAKNYAAKWVNGYNPNFHNFTPDGGDCTNFVSQAIRQGGITFTSRSLNPLAGHWYYYNKNVGWGRSRSWTHAHWFRQHFGDVNGGGAKRSYQMRKYDMVELLNNYTEWKNLFNSIGAGDIIQYSYKSNGETFHSQFVHRLSTNEDGLKVSVAQHTDNGWENLWKFMNRRRNEGKQRWITVIRLNVYRPW